jgi:hypothetical protein
MIIGESREFAWTAWTTPENPPFLPGPKPFLHGPGPWTILDHQPWTGAVWSTLVQDGPCTVHANHAQKTAEIRL